MIVAIIGSRTFSDYRFFRNKCNQLLALSDQTTMTIISGGARGTDRLAERYAREKAIRIKVYQAEWEILGKTAGFIRNDLMLIDCTHVIAFWDGCSHGTRHMVVKAKLMKKQIRVVIIKNQEPARILNPQGSGFFQ